MSAISLDSKSDALLAHIAGEHSQVATETIKTLIAWQMLVSREKKRDEALAQKMKRETIHAIQEECDIIAFELYGFYKKLRHNSLLANGETQRILAVLIERLAEDYRVVLEKCMTE